MLNESTNMVSMAVVPENNDLLNAQIDIANQGSIGNAAIQVVVNQKRSEYTDEFREKKKEYTSCVNTLDSKQSELKQAIYDWKESAVTYFVNKIKPIEQAAVKKVLNIKLPKGVVEKETTYSKDNSAFSVAHSVAHSVTHSDVDSETVQINMSLRGIVIKRFLLEKPSSIVAMEKAIETLERTVNKLQSEASEIHRKLGALPEFERRLELELSKQIIKSSTHGGEVLSKLQALADKMDYSKLLM